MAVKKSTKKAAPKKTAAKAPGKSLADFRAVHDKSFVVPGKIKEGLATLGNDGWENENEFIRICGVSTLDFARFREDFADFYVVVGGVRSGKRVWAGSKALAAKMREMV